MRRRETPTGLLLLAAGLCAPSVSADQRPARLANASEGVVTLALAPEGRALIRGATFQPGSDIDEIQHAVVMCSYERSGAACETQSFVYEFSEQPFTVSDFLLDRLEVAVGDYRRCVEIGPCAAPPLAAGGKRFEQPDLPVTMVTYGDAVTYCRFRGGRLPTEAEWELAARGVRGRRFPWGNVFDPYFANAGRFALGVDPFEAKDGFLELAPVGSFQPGKTPEGVFDLAGNAEEWVADWFAEYPSEPETNPKGPTSGDQRVVRGGSYGHAGAWLRGAARGRAAPGSRAAFRGFRCAYEAP